MPPIDQITFEGKDTEDATLLLQSVKRVAFALDRQRDQEWLADYVETCLAGTALMWYVALDEKTRYDFNSLRIAMIERFSQSIPMCIPRAPPAAALPHPLPPQDPPRCSRPPSK